MDSQKIYSEVSERYSAAARGSNTGFGDTIAKAFGYSEEDLAGIPKDSNMGLSCGNPLAITTLRDVGSQRSGRPASVGNYPVFPLLMLTCLPGRDRR